MPAAPPRQLRRLSSAEMAERRRQGLCYNCDEPYVQGHKCQRLFYLEVSDFDASAELSPEKDPENSELPPLISLHAITGIRPEETMQLRVNIGNHELTALLDSGSTHNFVSMEAARHIGLSFHDSKGKNVVVANGDRVACRGLARDVAICIAGSFFTVSSILVPWNHRRGGPSGLATPILSLSSLEPKSLRMVILTIILVQVLCVSSIAKTLY